MSASEHWMDRLSEHLDGELSPSEREACEAHLATCPECADTFEEIRAVVAQASLLPDVPPGRDLWPSIEGRLPPRRVAGPSDGPSRAVAPARVTGTESGRPTAGDAEVVSLDSRRRRVSLTVPQLAAAAVALMVLSAGAVWLALPGAGTVADGAVAAGGAIESAGGEALTGAGPQVTLAAAYDPAISQLGVEFQRRRGELDPETIRVVEENLAIIDAAIAEAGQALAEDPASAFLNSHLAGAMRRKVDLLRRVTTIERTES